MTETAKIYYHKPKVRRTNLRRELLENSEFEIANLSSREYHTTREAIHTALKTKQPDTPVITECTVPKDSIFGYCANTLRSLGLTGKYDGFVYMCRAIEEILMSEDPPHFQSIYYDISKEYGVNGCSVERSIRYAINFVKRSGNRHNMAVIFGEALSDEKNFSNSKFLTIIASNVYEKLLSLEVQM